MFQMALVAFQILQWVNWNAPVTVQTLERHRASCFPETEAEAGESHLQLCGRQPRRADVHRGRGDRGGRRGGPGVVGQYRLGFGYFALHQSTGHLLSPCVTMAARAESHDLTPADALFPPTAKSCCFLCEAPCLDANRLQKTDQIC